MAWLTTPSIWYRRKPKLVKGSTAGAQTDYQLKLTVYKGSGIDTVDTIYLGGYVNNDFSDLRFTSSDETTLLSYWIESYISGVSAIVWIKIDSIPADPFSKFIYIYYDNLVATYASNGTNTFTLFDHFLGSTLNTAIWEGPSGGILGDGTTKATLSNSIMTLYAAYVAPWDYDVISKTAFSSPMIVRSRNYMSAGTSDFGFQINPYISPYQQMLTYASSMVIRDTGEAIISSNITTGSYTTKEIRWDDANNTVSWYDNDVQCTNSPYTVGTNIPSAPLRVVSARINQANTMYVDWILVRKYTTPEPIWDESSSEQTYTANLTVSSTPTGAEIWINSIDQGVITTSWFILDPGTYTIILTKPGYEGYIEIITLESNVDAIVYKDLIPIECIAPVCNFQVT